MESSTDYLIVGAGASGLAFADSLVEETDAEVTLIDRQDAPGGHWLHSYPFLQLHSPSAYYGVNSLPLGQNRIDETGFNAGFYERATGAEVLEYFGEATSSLEATGRAQVLSNHEHLGNGPGVEQVRNLASGEVCEIEVREKLVDARYLEASVPATHTRPFEVADGAQVVAVNDLPAAAGDASLYVVLGGGKTAADACTWLLGNGVEPDRIRWVRPREMWFEDRKYFQPLEQVGSIMAGLAIDAEAAAGADGLEDLFARLEDAGRLSRLDRSVPATMYRGTMLSSGELAQLRQIEDVVRLGHVRGVEARRLVLAQGEVETPAGALHVDCTALGLNNSPARPVFEADRITVQSVRHNSPTFSAALIGFVEAHRDEEVEKNRLCPPNSHASSVGDWPQMMSRSWRTEQIWPSEPDVMDWVLGSRLNLIGALPEHAGEEPVQAAVGNFVTHVASAIERLGRMQ